MVGPNCLGVIVPGLGLNATFAADMPAPGHLAFLSQSGALCTAVRDLALQEVDQKMSTTLEVPAPGTETVRLAIPAAPPEEPVVVTAKVARDDDRLNTSNVPCSTTWP